MTTKTEAARQELLACLSDDEDGPGYLWDMMRGEHGKTILSTLSYMADVYITATPAPPESDATCPSNAPTSDDIPETDAKFWEGAELRVPTSDEEGEAAVRTIKRVIRAAKRRKWKRDELEEIVNPPTHYEQPSQKEIVDALISAGVVEVE